MARLARNCFLRPKTPVARSSTSFQPGNKAGKPNFKPGNQLALKHGAHSETAIQARLPEVLARVQGELEQMPFLTPPDGSLVRSYAYVTTQKELLEEHFDRSGGMFTAYGAPKKGASFYLQLVHRQQELAKVLGLGPGPRAQMAQAMAGASVSAIAVKEAQERLRAKHALKVLEGAS